MSNMRLFSTSCANVLSLYSIAYFILRLECLAMGWEHLTLKQLSSIYDMVAGTLFKWPRRGMGMKTRTRCHTDPSTLVPVLLQCLPPCRSGEGTLACSYSIQTLELTTH